MHWGEHRFDLDLAGDVPIAEWEAEVVEILAARGIPIDAETEAAPWIGPDHAPLDPAAGLEAQGVAPGAVIARAVRPHQVELQLEDDGTADGPDRSRLLLSGSCLASAILFGAQATMVLQGTSSGLLWCVLALYAGQLGGLFWARRAVTGRETVRPLWLVHVALVILGAGNAAAAMLDQGFDLGAAVALATGAAGLTLWLTAPWPVVGLSAVVFSAFVGALSATGYLPVSEPMRIGAAVVAAVCVAAYAPRLAVAMTPRSRERVAARAADLDEVRLHETDRSRQYIARARAVQVAHVIGASVFVVYCIGLDRSSLYTLLLYTAAMLSLLGTAARVRHSARMVTMIIAVASLTALVTAWAPPISGVLVAAAAATAVALSGLIRFPPGLGAMVVARSETPLLLIVFCLFLADIDAWRRCWQLGEALGHAVTGS
ncbi:hypothetical protein LLS1_24300 [Leifsonia sp. LS1]|nr:hypothetical protein LLS1_24300 [Leifsonia sp. LS1]